jgi:hypothetical protein
MILNCLLCNRRITLPARPLSCSFQKRNRAGGITKSQCIVLCKALNIPVDAFKRQFHESNVCLVCADKVRSIAHVVREIENLQETLRDFRREVQDSLEGALKGEVPVEETEESRQERVDGGGTVVKEADVDVDGVRASTGDVEKEKGGGELNLVGVGLGDEVGSRNEDEVVNLVEESSKENVENTDEKASGEYWEGNFAVGDTHKKLNTFRSRIVESKWS